MLNIAVDGPAGAGKSTVAKQIAKKLGILYLDTGAMYRAVALYVVRQGVSVNDEKKVESVLDDIDVKIRYVDGTQHVFLNGEDVSTEIREHYVSKAASDVSKIPAVRLKLVALQRQIASENDLIVDGRDIGSYVLPNASNKFFLTASPEVRAKRRFDELTAKGEKVEYETILADIKDRDYNDSHRKFAPLIKTEDAVLLDSSEMNVDQVVAFMLEKING